MPDQATLLRKLVHQRGPHSPVAVARRPQLVVVSGGKGGVGTTTLAAHLAATCQNHCGPTALVDADPHHADVALLLDLPERFTLGDVLAGRRTAAEALQPGPAGIAVLSGCLPPVRLPREASPRLLPQFDTLGDRVGLLVVDTGNAPHPLRCQLWERADLILAVTTPDEPAVVDTYAAIKSTIGPTPPERPIHVVVNRIADPQRGPEVFVRLDLACRRFLGISLEYAGAVRDAPAGNVFGLAALESPLAEDVGRLARFVALHTAGRTT